MKETKKIKIKKLLIIRLFYRTKIIIYLYWENLIPLEFDLASVKTLVHVHLDYENYSSKIFFVF